MPKRLYLYLVTFFLIPFSTISAKGSNANEAETTGDLKSQIKAYILHHLEDSHDFNLLSYKDETINEKVYIGFPLPVIIWDNGLKIFSSSKLKHGKEVVKLGDNHYKLYHGKIYKTNAQGTITYDDYDHPTNTKPIDFSITKNVISILFTALLMFVLFRGLAQSYQKKRHDCHWGGTIFGTHRSLC